MNPEFPPDHITCWYCTFFFGLSSKMCGCGGGLLTVTVVVVQAPSSEVLIRLDPLLLLVTTNLVTPGHGRISVSGHTISGQKHVYCRVTRLVDENLPLTQFRQFRQLVGRYCSYLLPRQVDGTFQTYVNRRFVLT